MKCSSAVKISYIIPVYNAEAYLRECLESIAAQTAGTAEIIIVDDGSADRSPEIIGDFREAHPGEAEILVFRQENSGPSAARNRGLSEASGEWVCFTDADDYLKPDFAEKLLSAAGEADACLSGRIRVNIKNGKEKAEPCPEGYYGKEEIRKLLPGIMKMMRGATGRLYRTSLIREHGISFREDLRYGEDMYFNFLYFKYAENASFVRGAGYMHRLHTPGSLAAGDRTFFLKRWKMQRECIRDSFRHGGTRNEHF